jgi:hypothetical protein
MQSSHCKKKRENSQWVFGSKEMRFKPRPTAETFPHHIFGWAAIFWPQSTTAMSYSLQQLEFLYWMELSIWSKFKRLLITLTSSLKWSRQNVNWPITKHFPLISKFHNTNDTSSTWNNFINWEMVVCCLNLIEPTNMRTLNLGHAY